jgi:ATP-dependent Clp protease ATP-binding subunit ClpA
LKQKLTTVFRPELVNRFSRVIVFKSLSRSDVSRIAELQLNQLGKDLGSQGIGITFTPEAVQKISELGYDPKFGARPLREAIETHVRAPLAKSIIAKEVRRGSQVTLVLRGDELVFE